MINGCKPRLAVVASHPIQHFCPLYSAIHCDGRVELRVFFGSRAGSEPYFDAQFGRVLKWQEDLLDGFDSEFLPDASKGLPRNGLVGSRFIAQALARFEPHVIQIYGFAHPLSRSALRWGKKHGRSILQVSDSELRYRRPLLARLRKRIIVPLLLRDVDGFLTVGDQNEQYYLHYGARPDQFFRCPFSVDERRLSAALLERDSLRAAIRLKHEIGPDDVIALTIGKLTSRKAIHHAIKAFIAVSERAVTNLHLIIAGDGPEREALAAIVPRGLRKRVHFAGFVPVTELPSYYVASDIILHTAERDPHPLAISEAIFCGLAVIVSDRVGSVGPTDDVQIGANGYEYPFGDIVALSSHLERLVTNAPERKRMQEKSSIIGRQRDMQVSVAAVVAATQALRVRATQ